MLAAEHLAGRYGSYWAAVLPQLETFVRLTNLGPKRLERALPIDFPAERQALVSETGFMFWVHEAEGRAGYDAAEVAARQRLAELLPPAESVEPLSATERRTAEDIGRRISAY